MSCIAPPLPESHFRDARLTYSQHLWRERMVVLGFLFLLFICILFSLSWSTKGFDPLQLWSVFFGEPTGNQAIVIYNIRLPRVMAAVTVGAALGLAGVMMQNLLRNPLASSSTLGVSQGAACGAAMAIVFFDAGVGMDGYTGSAIAVSNPYIVTIFAFIGGIATTAIILLLARLTHVQPVTMILAGIALGAMAAGATALVQFFADDVKVATIVYWTFGDLGRVSWQQIGFIAILTVLALLFYRINAWDYNAIDAGVPTAISLGVAVNRQVLIGMVLAALVASVSVAFVGTISFVGLIAPHMARRLTGNDHRYLIPAAAFAGAILLVLAELASRTILSPSVLPIGAMTAFLGAPIFLYMILNRRLLTWSR